MDFNNFIYLRSKGFCSLFTEAKLYAYDPPHAKIDLTKASYIIFIIVLSTRLLSYLNMINNSFLLKTLNIKRGIQQLV